MRHTALAIAHGQDEALEGALGRGGIVDDGEGIDCMTAPRSHPGRLARTPEEFKAWSQNLGHGQVMTTFASYGTVSWHRQAEIMRQFRPPAEHAAERCCSWVTAGTGRP